MIYETVVNEIESLRSDARLPKIRIEALTPLEDLGFDSLFYTILMTRLETKLELLAWDSAFEATALPSVVADLVRMFRAHAKDSDCRSAA